MGRRPDQVLIAPAFAHACQGTARRTSTPLAHSVSVPAGPVAKQPLAHSVSVPAGPVAHQPSPQRPRLPLSSRAATMPYPKAESPMPSPNDTAARVGIPQAPAGWQFAPPKREGNEAQGGSFRPSPTRAVGHWLPAEKAGMAISAHRGRCREKEPGSMPFARSTSAPSSSAATSTPVESGQTLAWPSTATSSMPSRPRDVAPGIARSPPGPWRTPCVLAGQRSGREEQAKPSPISSKDSLDRVSTKELRRDLSPQRGLSSLRYGQPPPPDAVIGITVPSPRGKLFSSNDLGGELH